MSQSPSKPESFSDLSCFAMPRGVVKQADTDDWKAFVHASDPEANCDYAEPARTKIGLVKASFLKYVVLIYWVLLLTYRARFTSQNLKPGDYTYWLQNITLRVRGLPLLVFQRPQCWVSIGVLALCSILEDILVRGNGQAFQPWPEVAPTASHPQAMYGSWFSGMRTLLVHDKFRTQFLDFSVQSFMSYISAIIYWELIEPDMYRHTNLNISSLVLIKEGERLSSRFAAFISNKSFG